LFFWPGSEAQIPSISAAGKQIERRVIATFGLPGAWASRATITNGSTFCASAIENLRLAVGAANSAKGAAA
jgi:hypothetical protein